MILQSFKGVFGLGHEVEWNGSNLHLDLIPAFGRKVEPESTRSRKGIFGTDSEFDGSTESVESPRSALSRNSVVLSLS